MTNLKPTTPDVTLANSTVVSVKNYKFKPVPKRIVAIVKKVGLVVLWQGDDYDAHSSDTEEQLEAQLKALLDA